MGDTVRRAVRDRLLREMLGGVQDGGGAGWKVLILDENTKKIMSSSMKMSDIMDEGVSVVEKLEINREPLNMPAVYFVEPNMRSVERIVADFNVKPLYPSVHIFFSSAVTPDLVNTIKRSATLIQHLKTLKEVNVDFLTADSRTVYTGNTLALQRLLGENCENDANAYGYELESIAAKLATMFSTMNDFPVIRYKVGKSPEASDPPGQGTRSLLTQRFSQKLMERMLAMQRAGQLPNRETCEVLVLDRSVDPVAPLIHEWYYEPLVYDLLDVKGNVVKHTTESAGGKTEVKDVVLDESDSLWVELRGQFIADVYTTLHRKFTEFQSQNRAARYQGAKGTDNASNTNMKALIQALPQFREVLSKLSLHIALSGKIKDATNARKLAEVGELEQDLVFGERTSKELMAFLTENATQLQAEDKLRLFACYLATHPEKMDAGKKAQWQKLARLSSGDMATLCNLEYLGISVMKEQASASATAKAFFGKKKKAVRQARAGKADSSYALSRFEPLLMEIVENLVNNRLSSDEYAYVRQPSGDMTNGVEAAAPASARTNRTGLNWAKKAILGGGEDSGGGGGSGGRKLIVVLLGGATHGEVRCVHELSAALKRDIILVTTDIDTPHTFLDKLSKMGGAPPGPGGFEVERGRY